MILVDTGPLVALFDPADNWHEPCVARLRELREPLYTTIPVLTEAFHLLSPASLGAQKLMDFVAQRGLTVWFLADAHLDRAFELMSRYADCAMDLADASLVVAAEQLGTRKIFSIDRRDFATYRVKRGHRLVAFQLVGP
jgi:predicted nucleic acid-binding protein